MNDTWSNLYDLQLSIDELLKNNHYYLAYSILFQVFFNLLKQLSEANRMLIKLFPQVILPFMNFHRKTFQD